MSVAEQLLELARSIRFPAGRLIEAGPLDSTQLARCRLSLNFLRAAPAVQLRAIAEEWDLPTIVRALH